MLNIKKTISLAALLCGLLIIFSSATNASAQFIPPGSYKKSCKDIKTKGANMFALCKPKSDSVAAATVSLNDYFECDGDISNNDGKLGCTRNSNSALMKKAKAAIGKYFAIVMNGNAAGLTDADYRKVLRDMFTKHYEQQFYDNLLGENLGGATALGFYLEKLNSPEYAQVKRMLIGQIFAKVYGTPASKKAYDYYDAQKTIGYSDILDHEKQAMKASQALHHQVINSAYRKSMGRDAMSTEYDYWMPRDQYFEEILEASRAYLYSPNGAKDLSETVRRVLKVKSIAIGKPMDNFPDETVKAAINKYTEKRAIYYDMISTY